MDVTIQRETLIETIEDLKTNLNDETIQQKSRSRIRTQLSNQGNEMENEIEDLEDSTREDLKRLKKQQALGLDKVKRDAEKDKRKEMQSKEKVENQVQEVEQTIMDEKQKQNEIQLATERNEQIAQQQSKVLFEEAAVIEIVKDEIKHTERNTAATAKQLNEEKGKKKEIESQTRKLNSERRKLEKKC